MKAEETLRYIFFSDRENMSLLDNKFIMYHAIYMTNPPVLKVVYPLGKTPTELGIQLTKLFLALRCPSYIEKLKNVLDLSGSFIYPVAVGIEYQNLIIRRIKVYMRGILLSSHILCGFLDKIGFSTLSTTIKSIFKYILRGNDLLPKDSYVISFDLYSPEQIDLPIKVDIALPSLDYSDAEANKVILQLLDRLKLDYYPYQIMYNCLCEEEFSKNSLNYHTFVGIGLKPDTHPRVSVYMKPHFSSLRFKG
ncbi:MAG TPA: hypothetical protein ENF30_01915 [Candidatus Desulfofervidus auxilii]|uniref:Uncharacterized protein n=1 Tax=Desulfofervidus auxilii TaxID=1621989 RepID=A0A7V0IA76_DESA2|nr:hypothetical protein [Candidatus Desulfofervidus auxilii]